MKHILISAVLFSFAIRTSQAQPHIRVEPGQLPIILSAPHGGYLTPESMKDRTCAGCTTLRDDFTQELTDEIARALEQLTGKRPHVVVNQLARIKMDANRDLPDAADGDSLAALAWHAYHEAMDSAKASVTRTFGKGLVLDMHGHGHTIQRLELGYLPDEDELRVSDADLNASRGNRNTFNSLVATNVNGYTFAQLIRGPKSLGQMYENRGYPSVPSQTTPFPLIGEPYFAGGYITQRHGSRNGGTIDAVQVEANRSGVRHTADERRSFADSTARILVDFFLEHYGIDLMTVGTSIDKEESIPMSLELAQNVPNPFNPSTVIGFRVGEIHELPVRIRLSVYDVLGREVAVLLDGVMPSGRHQVSFDATGLSSGLYVYRLQTSEGALSRKMHLVK